jgi:replication-associated recombination protein RarA
MKIIPISPAAYEPASCADLIGKARAIGTVLFDKIGRLREPESQRLVFTGPIGCGKSTLARLLAERMAGHGSNIERLSGKNVNTGTVNAWIAGVATGNLFGGWSVKIIEEIDKCTPDGIVLMLDYLDLVKRYPGNAVIASTNLPLNECFKDRRLASRFQCFPFDAPGFLDIAAFLAERFAIPQEQAEEIAMNCSGDVRAACNDAQSWLDVERAGHLLAA